MKNRLLYAFLFGFLASADNATACSILQMNSLNGPMVCRNYDWHTGTGSLIVNKRGMQKRAMVTSNPAEWVSRYGSLTFNQYGREFPCGGVNEKGLVVEVLWLEGTEYPRPDQRPALPTLQWIQYQLDTAASVEDVVASDDKVRVQTISASFVHFFVADRNGNAAVVEFLDGRTVIHQGGDLPSAALTNSTYESSVDYLRGYETRGQTGHDGSSLGRFACAATESQQVGSDPVDRGFEILRNVAQGGFTKWSIVYDLNASRVHFCTQKGRRQRSVDLRRLDFSNSTPVQMLDLDEDLQGDITNDLRTYSFDDNRATIKRAFSETPVFDVLAGALVDRIANYPASCETAEPEMSGLGR